MKIVSIQIVNSGAIECFSVDLNGDNLELSGGTGSGKTTAASALFDVIKKRSDQLRHGEKKGLIAVTLSDGAKTIYAERSTTKSASKVVLTAIDSDGKKSDISINDFKQMISDLSINPHAIISLTPKQQAETLLKSAKISIDLDKVSLDIANLEVDRLASFRTIATLKPGEKPEKTDPVDISELISSRDSMQEVNASNQKKRDFLAGLEGQLVIADDDIRESKETIRNFQHQLDAAKNGLARKQDTKLELVNRIDKGEQVISEITDNDLSDISLQISNAQQTNDSAADYKRWVEKNNCFIEEEENHSNISDNIKALQEQKTDALNSAKWPIDGLSVVDGKVIYNDCLLSNLGESEQMLVCAALAIEDIKSHPLKVVRMDGIESMSKEDFVKLQKLFNGEGIQVLSTRVSRGDVEPQEIVIIDGKYS